MGIDFNKSTHQILYKGQSIASHEYDYVINNDATAKIVVYKKEEEIETQAKELAGYNKLFGFKNGFVLGIPSKEDQKVVIKEV
jgi:hypothetical protein